MKTLDEKIINICKETSTTLTGSDRRLFQAKITNAYLDGNPNKAESVFGWGRNTVKLGLKELETGYICYVDIHQRGDKKTEEKLLNLEQDIFSVRLISYHSTLPLSLKNVVEWFINCEG